MAVIDLNVALKTKDILESICEWNEARYEREHCTALTGELLNEELTETVDAVEAGNSIAILDGIGDIFYVAIGALWKVGYDATEIKMFCDDAADKLVPPLPIAVRWYTMTYDERVLPIIAISADQELCDMLGSSVGALEVIRAICDSNDTKEVRKTDSTVKANLTKGDNYVSPTRALEQIARKYRF